MATAEVLIYRKRQRYVAADVGGQLVAAVDPVAPGNVMVVDEISLSANPYVPSQCFLYLDDVAGLPFDQSNNGGRDRFEGAIEVPGGSQLFFVWTGEVGASTLSALVHFSLYRTLTVPDDPTLSTWRPPR